MTAVSTAQFATQSAGLITTLKDGTLGDSDFAAQWAGLVESWGVSNPALAAAVQGMVTQGTTFQAQVLNWLQGAATGGAATAAGTGSGGPYYPITGGDGTTRWVICPAGIAATAVGPSSSLSTTAIDSLPAATLSETNPKWPVSVDDGQGGRLLKEVNFFPSRQTMDMAPVQQMLAIDVLPGLRVGVGEIQLSAGVLSTGLTGVVNPKLPPYNCKGDHQEVRDAATTPNSAVVNSPSGQFAAGDVGKLVYLTQGGPGYTPFYTSIQSVQSATQITLAAQCSVYSTSRMHWGTDDTAGMQAAIDACRAPSSDFSYGGCVLVPPGGYMCRPLTYHARMAIVGYGGRISYFFRIPSTDRTTRYGYSSPYNSPMLVNGSFTDDFPCIMNVGLHGGNYVQVPGYGGGGFYFQSQPGNVPLPQDQPSPWFQGIRIWETADDGFWVFGDSGGQIIGIEAYYNWSAGIRINGYDYNISTLHAESNWHAGVVLDTSSANCNIMNVKSSYNGVNAYNQTDGCNLAIIGSGHNISNARLQESWGSNVFITGSWNKLGDITCDDTGDTYPVAGNGNTPLAYRAGLAFGANTAVANILNDVSIGCSVHTTDYLTHALFFEGNASNNRGRVYTKPGIVYYDGGSSPKGTVAGGTGAYAPGPVGTTSSGGSPGGSLANVISLDGVNIS